MEQSELNKKLYEAIQSSSVYSNKFEQHYVQTHKAATSCEIICLQEKIDLLATFEDELHEWGEIQAENYIQSKRIKIEQQLDSLKKV